MVTGVTVSLIHVGEPLSQRGVCGSGRALTLVPEGAAHRRYPRSRQPEIVAQRLADFAWSRERGTGTHPERECAEPRATAAAVRSVLLQAQAGGSSERVPACSRDCKPPRIGDARSTLNSGRTAPCQVDHRESEQASETALASATKPVYTTRGRTVSAVRPPTRALRHRKPPGPEHRVPHSTWEG